MPILKCLGSFDAELEMKSRCDWLRSRDTWILKRMCTGFKEGKVYSTIAVPSLDEQFLFMAEMLYTGCCLNQEAGIPSRGYPLSPESRALLCDRPILIYALGPCQIALRSNSVRLGQTWTLEC